MSIALVKMFEQMADTRKVKIQKICKEAEVAHNTLPAVVAGNKSMYSNSIQFILRRLHAKRSVSTNEKIRIADIMLGKIKDSRYAQRTKRRIKPVRRRKPSKR